MNESTAAQTTDPFLFKAAVLFDLDGVLVLTETVKAEAHAATIRELGGQVKASFYDRYMGESAVIVRSAFLKKARIRCDAERYERLFERNYLERIELGVQAAPGVRDLLELLAKHEFALAVVTSSSHNIAMEVLDRASLAGIFDCIISASENIRPKPEPDAYQWALWRLKVSNTAAVVMEDSLAGVTAARAAGISVIGIRHPLNRLHDFSGVFAELESLEHTDRILEIIQKRLWSIRQRNTETALKRYETIMLYLASDNAIFWNRNNLFFAANMGLLAIVGEQIGKGAAAEGFQEIALRCECAVGFLFCLMWLMLNVGGRRWMNRWEKNLRGLEEEAFGEIDIYRRSRPSGLKWLARLKQSIMQTRHIIDFAIGVLVLLWLGIMMFVSLWHPQAELSPLHSWLRLF